MPMADVVAFKSGKDLARAAIDDECVECEACGRNESDERAYQEGWQLVPAVCPNCLRWTAVEISSCCFGSTEHV
jgi:hypothetical protein